MLANDPNPFCQDTYIAFDIACEKQVLLEIFDRHGHQIKQMVRDNLMPGRHEVEWDATDNSGKILPAGVYFYRVSSGEFVKTFKMILI